MAGVEIRPDLRADRITQAQQRLRVVDDEPRVHFQCDHIHTMVAAKARLILPVGDDLLIPLPFQDSQEIRRPGACHPVGVLAARAIAWAPGEGNDPPHTDLLAGTSLASPTQASLLADTLSASSTTVGVGDIHAALYQGAANGAVADIKSDVKSWGNGTYHSGEGYDLVTGLGSPVWTKLQSWLGQFDMRAPRATRTTSFAIQPTVPTGTYSQWSAPLTSAPAPGDCSSATVSSAPTSVQLPSNSPDGTYTFWVAGISDVPSHDFLIEAHRLVDVIGYEFVPDESVYHLCTSHRRYRAIK